MFITLSSCDVNEPKKDKPKPEGYQEDIPWPSLADSPWPMFHGNPQSNGRSKYYGAKVGIIESKITLNDFHAGVVLANDSVIFIADNFSQKLIDKTGKLKWEFLTSEETITTPIITSDGKIFSAYETGNIYCYSINGNKQWTFKTKGHISCKNIINDKNGNIYVVDKNKILYCISSSGNKIWELQEERISPNAGLSFSPNGEKLFLSGKLGVLCIDIISQSIIWSFGNIDSYGAPLIDSQGNIYIISGNRNDETSIGLYSLYSDGKIRWCFKNHQWREEWGFYSTPAEMTMDKYGNIYFGMDTLYSVDYNGKLNWKKTFGFTASALTCDNDNVVYFIEDLSGKQSMKLYAIYGESGNIKWSILINEPHLTSTTSSLAIANGRIYLPTQGKYFYIIK